MQAGRPPAGPKHARKLAASQRAKKRLEVILETIAGEKSVDEACEELGIGPAYFHRIRDQALEAAAQRLEPGTPGRPSRRPDPAQERIGELERELERKEIELQAAEVRTELALTMPEVVHEPQPPQKKRPRRGGKVRARLRLPRRSGKRSR